MGMEFRLRALVRHDSRRFRLHGRVRSAFFEERNRCVSIGGRSAPRIQAFASLRQHLLFHFTGRCALIAAELPAATKRARLRSWIEKAGSELLHLPFAQPRPPPPE